MTGPIFPIFCASHSHTEVDFPNSEHLARTQWFQYIGAMKNSKQVYFDCNATTPTLPRAAQAAMEVMEILYGNPSSSHLAGLKAKHILETTRDTVAEKIGAGKKDQIIFTSGATEAIQTAVFSCLQALPENSSKKTILYGSTEHKAVPEAVTYWVDALKLKLEIKAIPADENGQLDIEFIKKYLSDTFLICTMAVNNETGCIQNLEQIESLIKKQKNLHWLVDSVQGLGKIPLNLKESSIDYAPFSGHKLYAPKGIGFLYVKDGAPFSPLIVGGGQEKGLRSGTENLPGVAALGAILSEEPFHATKKLKTFQNQIIKTLKENFKGIVFNTPFYFSVPTTVNFSIPGLSSKEVLDLFDSAGVRLSSGSACSSKSVTPSHVLQAMGLPKWQCESAIRLSFGPATSEEEIKKGCESIKAAAMALAGSCFFGQEGDFEPPRDLRDGAVQFRDGATNSWVIADKESRAAVIIDPCEAMADRLENFVRCQELKLVGILDTHSHGDHESVAPLLKKILSNHLVNPQKKTDHLGWYTDIEVTLGDGTKIPAMTFGKDMVLAKAPTPGHTDDSSCLLYGKIKGGKLSPKNIKFAFCGDTILGGGLGRTNFTTSNTQELFESLTKLQEWLGSNTLLCPAHDYINSFGTTLKAEQEANQLLQTALSKKSNSLPEFLKQKEELDREIAKLESEFQGTVCGVTPQDDQVALELSIDWASLKKRLQSAKAPLVIDVREPQEYALYKDWGTLGLKVPPRNVPLSRFANFMSELLETQEKNSIVLLCRSGNRSLQAAQSLRRLGLNHVWNLEGGVALGEKASAS